MSWIFNGTQIFSGDHYGIVDIYSDQGKTKISPKVRTQLTISNFSYLDVGAYICSVITEVNAANDTIWLSVKSKGRNAGILSYSYLGLTLNNECLMGLQNTTNPTSISKWELDRFNKAWYCFTIDNSLVLIVISIAVWEEFVVVQNSVNRPPYFLRSVPFHWCLQKCHIGIMNQRHKSAM